MPTTPHPSGLSFQKHQGVGARLVRRLGGALRGAFAGVARLRRPAAPAFSPNALAAENPPAPISPRQSRAPRRPRAAPPAPAPAQPGWIARWFGITPRQTALPRPAFPDDGGPDFTPEKNPGLSPEACAILNMPVEECPPEVLRILLTALAEHLVENLPPELGLTDPQTMFASLWGLLAGPLDEIPPDAEAAEQPDETPALPMEAVPDAAPMPPDKRPDAKAAILPDSAAIAVATASPASPDTTVPPKPDRRRSRSLRHRWQRLFHRWQRLSCCCQTFLSRSWRNAPRTLPPPRRLYYACAGPP